MAEDEFEFTAEDEKEQVEQEKSRNKARRTREKVLEPLYSPQELAEMWGLHEQTIISLIKAGDLRSVRITNNRIRVPESSVEQYLESRTQGGLNVEGVLEIQDFDDEEEEHVIG